MGVKKRPIEFLGDVIDSGNLGQFDPEEVSEFVGRAVSDPDGIDGLDPQSVYMSAMTEYSRQRYPAMARRFAEDERTRLARVESSRISRMMEAVNADDVTIGNALMAHGEGDDSLLNSIREKFFSR